MFIPELDFEPDEDDPGTFIIYQKNAPEFAWGKFYVRKETATEIIRRINSFDASDKYCPATIDGLSSG